MTKETGQESSLRLADRPADNDLAQTAISGVFWSSVQNWGSQTGSLIIFLVLARLLVPADFGLVALANTFIIFVNLALDQGLSTALVQREQIETDHWSTVFWFQLGLGICLTLLVWLISGFIAEVFEQPVLAPVLRSLSFIFILRSLILVQRASLRRHFAFKQIAIRALLGVFLSGLVGVGLALTGRGVWSLVGQQLMFEFVGVIVFWRASDWRPRLTFSPARLKELSSFGLSIFCSNVLAFFNNHFDTLLIGYFLGEVALGYYAIAYRVLQVLIQLLIGTGNQVALPVLSRLQTNPSRLLGAFYKIVGYVSLAAIPVFAGVSTLAPELVWVVFGQPWTPAVPVIQILAFSGLFYIILFFNTSVFVAIGRPVLRLRLELANVIINTIACLVAIKGGIIAVACAYAISDFLAIPISLWTLSKAVKISLISYTKLFCVPAGLTTIAVILAGSLRYWLNTFLLPSAVLIACTIAGAAVCIAGFKLFLPAVFRELERYLKSRLYKTEILQ